MSTIKAAFAALLACLVFSCQTHPVVAADEPPLCMPHEKVLQLGLSQYGEGPILTFALPDGSYFEVLARKGGQGWTLFRVLPNGVACVLAYGEGWDAYPPPDPSEKGA